MSVRKGLRKNCFISLARDRETPAPYLCLVLIVPLLAPPLLGSASSFSSPARKIIFIFSLSYVSARMCMHVLYLHVLHVYIYTHTHIPISHVDVDADVSKGSGKQGDSSLQPGENLEVDSGAWPCVERVYKAGLISTIRWSVSFPQSCYLHKILWQEHCPSSSQYIMHGAV